MSNTEKKERPKGKQEKGPGGFETIVDFSWTDGATLPTVPDAKKRGTITDQTKPTL